MGVVGECDIVPHPHPGPSPAVRTTVKALNRDFRPLGEVCPGRETALPRGAASGPRYPPGPSKDLFVKPGVNGGLYKEFRSEGVACARTILDSPWGVVPGPKIPVVPAVPELCRSCAGAVPPAHPCDFTVAIVGAFRATPWRPPAAFPPGQGGESHTGGTENPALGPQDGVDGSKSALQPLKSRPSRITASGWTARWRRRGLRLDVRLRLTSGGLSVDVARLRLCRHLLGHAVPSPRGKELFPWALPILAPRGLRKARRWLKRGRSGGCRWVLDEAVAE